MAMSATAPSMSELLGQLAASVAAQADPGRRQALGDALCQLYGEAVVAQDEAEERLTRQWDWLWVTPEDDARYAEREAIWLRGLRAYERLSDAIAAADAVIATLPAPDLGPCPF